MAIQSNFPAIKPTLLLDFANTKQLDPRIAFTRASTATYYGTQTAKAEENLVLQSQDFTTTWSTASQNSTVTANTTAAPDGTTTADTLTDNATSGVHRVAQTITTSNNNQLVLSCFLKYSTMQWVSLSAATNTGQWAGAKFDVQNGVLGSTSQQGTDWTANSSSITSVGNGWYRCVLVFTPGNSGSLGVYVNGATDGTTFTTSQRGAEVYTGASSSVFLWGAQLEQRSAVTAYTPTTTQTITNYIPQLLTAASGVARFDHNPTTFESLGLEIEEQRTNLLTYSEQFSDAAWTKGLSSITANTIIAPDGALTGDKLVEDTSNGSHLIRQSVTGLTSGSTLTLSVYLKAAERTTAQIYFNDNASTANRVQADFNLSSGTTSSATNFGTFTGASSSITSVGNGWYRCTISGVAVGVTAVGNRVIIGTTNYTGDGYSGIYIWGAQLEAGAFATSYIQTVASQVTRAADAASMTGTNFSSWFNQGEGTIYAEGLLSNPAVTGVQTRRFADINDGTNNNKIIFGRAATGADLRVVYTVSGVNINGTNGQTANNVFPSAKVAVAYEAADYAFSPNGATSTTSTAANVPVVNRLDIGGDPTNAATASANGTIKKIAYYPMRLVNAQLQALTS